MAVPAGGTPSEVQTGDTIHFAGGIAVDYLTGAFIKSLDPATGAVVWQDSAGVEQTGTLSLGSGGGNYYPIPDSDVGGTGNAITLTTGQSLSAYANGQMFFFNSNAANTGATTVDVDGIGARAVNRSSGQGSSQALQGGEITNADPVMVVYSTEFNEFQFLPLHIGTAAQRNVGNSEHQLPVLQSDDSLTAAHIAPRW